MKYETLLPAAKLLWSCPASKAPSGGLVIAGSTVAVLGTHLIDGRDLATGEVRWSTPSRAHEMFAISDSRIGSRGRKAKAGYWEGFDAATGESMWTQTFDGWPPESPQVCGNETWRLIHREERALTSLHGMSAEDGSKLESVIAPFAQTAGVSVEYFWTARHEASPIGRGLMRYDRANGEWETLSRDPHELCAIDDIGAVVLELADPEAGIVAAYDYAGGDALWRVEANGPVATADGVVHIVQGANLVEVARSSGKERWRAPFSEESELLVPRSFGKRLLARFRGENPKILDAATGKQVGTMDSEPDVQLIGGHAVVSDSEEVAVYRL